MFISVCGFSVLQQLVFGFRKKIQICFRIWIRYGFLFFLFGFRFIFDMSGNYAPPLISNSCETSACSACHNCIRSIWVLITGMWIYTGFHGFASGFRFGSNFCVRGLRFGSNFLHATASSSLRLLNRIELTKNWRRFSSACWSAKFF